MYQIVSILNGFIRETMISNPFEFISDNEMVAILFFSLFGGKVLYKIAFSMSGIFYSRRGNKTLGSIGYMFFYSLNVWILLRLQTLTQNITLILSLYNIIIIILFWGLVKIKKTINGY